MKKMLINVAHEEGLRIAVVDGQKLSELIFERPGYEQKIGNIYKAQITSVEPSLDAIFVNYGSERHGFLPLKEISREYFLTHPESSSETKPNIKELLKEGQELIVQVEKEERGNKGAALTTFISLAGSYLVLMPNNPRAGGISRRIEGDERDELRQHLSKLNIPESMGLIVRTAGVNKNIEELQWDLDILVQHWQTIKTASAERAAPFLIHQESDTIVRTIRDYLRQDIDEIIADDPTIYEKVKNYIQQVRPNFADKISLYTDSIPLFSRYEIEHQIEAAHQRSVQLPSGGSIVIDHSEALVSIDINSARATRGADIEETAFNTNLEAAEEIARQLRLRDIGGLIVIDFIDMSPVHHQREVENRLRRALQADRARVQIGHISRRFGLLEMSRQRLRPPLHEGIHTLCPRCNGQGTIRGVQSVASSILRILEEDALKERINHLQVQVPLDVGTYLLNEKRDQLAQIEKRHHVLVTIVPNPNMETPHYEIKRIQGGDASSRGKASYKLIEAPEQIVPEQLKKATPTRPQDEPVVKGITPVRPLPTKPTSSGLIKRLMSMITGDTKETKSESPQTTTEVATKENKPRTPPSQQRRHEQQSRDRGAYNRDRGSKEKEKDREQQHGPHRAEGETKHNRSRRGNRGGRHRDRGGRKPHHDHHHKPSTSTGPKVQPEQTTAPAVPAPHVEQTPAEKTTHLPSNVPEKTELPATQLPHQPVVVRPQKSEHTDIETANETLKETSEKEEK